MPDSPARPAAFVAEVADGGTMPLHNRRCMICGPDNPCGFGLEPRRDGDDVVADFTFGEAQEGARGLAHGGAVSALCDDLLGHVLTLQGTPAVTRRLEVEYLRPVVLGEPHHLRAHLDAVDGRKVWVRGSATGPDEAPRFTARGLFVRVPWEHFLAAMAPEERDRAERRLAELRGEGTDPHAP